MDQVFSTRLDENLVRQINQFVKQRSLTKKGFVEQALRTYFNQLGSNMEFDIIDRTFGAWQREETPYETWSRSRKALNNGLSRHARNK